MQISPASTKIPVDTPRSVGRSAAITDISGSFNKLSVRMLEKFYFRGRLYRGRYYYFSLDMAFMLYNLY